MYNNMKLTQEEKRIKLANYAGWHERLEPHGSHNATAWWHNQDRYPSYLMPVPDYFSDLNAVHELEKVLTFHQETEYVATLMRQHKDYPMTKGFMSAAAERCEAIGKTLNLW